MTSVKCFDKALSLETKKQFLFFRNKRKKRHNVSS